MVVPRGAQHLVAVVVQDLALLFAITHVVTLVIALVAVVANLLV